jgi:hypothetical protein
VVGGGGDYRVSDRALRQWRERFEDQNRTNHVSVKADILTYLRQGYSSEWASPGVERSREHLDASAQFARAAARESKDQTRVHTLFQ